MGGTRQLGICQARAAGQVPTTEPSRRTARSPKAWIWPFSFTQAFMTASPSWQAATRLLTQAGTPSAGAIHA